MTHASLYDKTVPLTLKKTQEWFASIITRPIDENSRMNPVSPSGVLMEKEAPSVIAPSPTLAPHQRIQIYNQQYWWRLLTTLHDTFPLVTRLFGYHDFNQTIAIPYLLKYPPNHWSLSFLGEHLPQWILDDYSADDQLLIYDAARIDWAFNCCFISRSLPCLDLPNGVDADGMSAMLDQALCLQPYVEVFVLDYDLFAFREVFIKQDGDYWLDHDFPDLLKGKKYYFVFYRTKKNDLAWKEIHEGQYHLLRMFKSGSTIDQACEWLEAQQESLYNEAAKNLASWFQEWVIRRWLSVIRISGSH